MTGSPRSCFAGLAACIVLSAALIVRAQTPHLSNPTGATSTVAAPGQPDLTAGQKLFAAHCAGCHGPAGEGARGPTLARPDLPRARSDEQLVRIIRSGISGTEMPGLRLRPTEVRDVAGWVRHLGRVPTEPVTGNAERGAALFASKGNCYECHAVQGRGGAVGPDLTDIGLRRSLGSLRSALLDPAAEVPKSFNTMRPDISMPASFVMVRAVARDGRSVVGPRINEDTFSIQIRGLDQQVYSFLKSELVEFEKLWNQTPMPSYREVFTKDELEDMIAYLASLKGTK